MPRKVDTDLIELSMKELDNCRDQDDAATCAYNMIMGGEKEPEEIASARKEIIKYLLAANDLNRLYFIVRSGIMTIISSLLFLGFVTYLRSVNTIDAIFIGVVSYFVSLFISRLFDSPINKISYIIVKFLNKRPNIKSKIMHNL